MQQVVSITIITFPGPATEILGPSTLTGVFGGPPQTSTKVQKLNIFLLFLYQMGFINFFTDSKIHKLHAGILVELGTSCRQVDICLNAINLIKP